MKKVHFVIGLLLLVACSIAFIEGCGSAASSGGGGGGGTAAAAWTYFGNNYTNKIYYVSPDAIAIYGTIELGCYSPYYIAPSSDGKKLYVSTAASKEIVVIDTGTNTITGLITLDAASQSKAMRVSSDGKCLYTGGPSGYIYKVDLEKSSTWEKSGAGSTVYAIALSSDNSSVYYSNGLDHIRKASTNDLSSVIDLITVPFDCYDMAVKDGKIYAPLCDSSIGECLVIDTTNDACSIITGEGTDYYGVVAIPGTAEVYISSNVSTGEVYIINTNAWLPTFEAGSITAATFPCPDYMAVTVDGKWVCVMDKPSHSKIRYIDTTSREVISDYTTIPDSGPGSNNIVIVYK